MPRCESTSDSVFVCVWLSVLSVLSATAAQGVSKSFYTM